MKARQLLSMMCCLMSASSGAAFAGTEATAWTSNHPTLTLEGARVVLAQALGYARAHSAPGASIAIVDSGGRTILIERLDGTFAASPDVSVGKARTAVAFQRATRDIEDAINKGRFAMDTVSAVTAFTPLRGGVPLVVDGQIAGAVGVSGAASAQQDDEIATAAAEALGTAGNTGNGLFYVPAPAVVAASSQGDTGATLLETRSFEVNASRRDAAGLAEIHDFDADVFYVIAGAASLVTGGTLVSPSTIAPGEHRGHGLDGGVEQHLAAGDVIVIPRGLPHWFRAVDSGFRYFVVKSHDAL